MSEEIEESITPQPKKKPTFFSANLNPSTHNLSKSHEVDGFYERSKHEELVESMLSKAVESVIVDVRRFPPKRRSV